VRDRFELWPAEIGEERELREPLCDGAVVHGESVIGRGTGGRRRAPAGAGSGQLPFVG
jgi:hypothetical protein